jgi:cytochrome c oxidase assembly protein subunit 15
MADSFLFKSGSEPVVIVRRFAFALAIATFFLMALGSATRVMNAGLSCPDWPLCYGEIVPTEQMNLQVFLEWFHRVVASTVGLLTATFLGIVVWYRTSLPRWLPAAAGWALCLVLFQGILGGLTVTELLRFDIVTAHLGTGLMFFCTWLVITVALLPYQAYNTVGKLPWFGSAAVGFVYLQSILGALVASRWAVHQCLAGADLCSVVNTHIAGVVPASLSTLAVIYLSWRTTALHPGLRRLAYTAGIFLLMQVAIGIGTYMLHLQIEPLTVLHQAVGAALLGTLVAFTGLAWRDRTEAV